MPVKFTGRFAIVCTVSSPAGREVKLYIGEGNSLRCGTDQLQGNENKQAFKQFDWRSSSESIE